MDAVAAEAGMALPNTAPDGAVEAASESVPLPTEPDAGCDANAPFGTPLPLESLDTASNEYDARLTVDELTVYFARSRPQVTIFSTQIYFATRADFTEPFGPAQLVSGIASSSDTTFAPSITANNLNLYFNLGGPGIFSIYIASRSTASDPFPVGVEIPGVNGANENGNPFVTPDGTSLYFYSDHYGAGGVPGELTELVVSQLEGGSFGPPVLIPALDTGEADNVTVSADQRTIFFGSTRSDPAGVDEDVWMSQRSSTSVDWDPPVPVTEVNSTDSDEPTWISADGCRLYLQSSRGGDSDFYVATRPN